MTLLLDSGALIALERDERPMWARLKAAYAAHDEVMTHGGVVGQVWRGGARQARLSQALLGVTVRPLDDELGRAAGRLLGSLGTTRQTDVIDAALVMLSSDGDDIMTADEEDFEVLALASGRHVELIRP